MEGEGFGEKEAADSGKEYTQIRKQMVLIQSKHDVLLKLKENLKKVGGLEIPYK